MVEVVPVAWVPTTSTASIEPICAGDVTSASGYVSTTTLKDRIRPGRETIHRCRVDR